MLKSVGFKFFVEMTILFTLKRHQIQRARRCLEDDFSYKDIYALRRSLFCRFKALTLNRLHNSQLCSYPLFRYRKFSVSADKYQRTKRFGTEENEDTHMFQSCAFW